jgi:hypothetical protein
VTGIPQTATGNGRRVLTAVLAALLLTGPVHAAEPAEQVRANAIYKDAKDRFDSNDFQRAFELASEAEKIFPHPAIVLLKARALRKLGRLREAVEAFKKADSPQLPKPLARSLSDERSLLADEMRIKGELLLEVTPDSAVISVDGDSQKGRFEKWLLAGKHRVEAVAPEFKPVVRTVELVPGETTRITITLVKQGGTLMVTAAGGLQGVDILVDGKLVEIPEGSRTGDRVPAMPVAVGKHEVVCARGAKRVSKSVMVELDGVVEARCEGIEPSGTFAASKALGWGGVAVGAGILGYGAWGVGSYYAVDKSDPRGVVSSNKPWLGSIYALGGVAAGVASYLFLVRDRPESSASAAPVAAGSSWVSR